jgi:hypothetical protein
MPVAAFEPELMVMHDDVVLWHALQNLAGASGKMSIAVQS